MSYRHGPVPQTVNQVPNYLDNELYRLESMLADLSSAIAARVGSMFFVAGANPPAGALKANGAVVSRTTYADLFNAIGTTFGVGDGSTTFGLPDLRGEFIRALDDGRGVDSGRVLGSSQVGTRVFNNGGAPGNRIPNDASNVLDGEDPTAPSITVGSVATSGGTLSFTFHRVRPRNIALLACIWYQ